MYKSFRIRQPQPITCLFTTYCGRIGEDGLCGVSISKSAVDFESIFEIEKTFEKMTALFE
ncbi:hypothetical protein NTHI1209_00575 [Haemophilus influenzae]|uniref:Uncharacterized protein n=1 Tax=Haemophilus influenzae TaxID=727 RepID=A0A158SVS8_HAEIF|nr:hypothetical protein NTHI1209_00575 [Haemophilus influenzae]